MAKKSPIELLYDHSGASDLNKSLFVNSFVLIARKIDIINPKNPNKINTTI